MSATAVAPAGDWAGTGTVRDASDGALIAAVRAGDDRAFELLYHRYRRRIGAYVYGMVSDHGRAEDITQEVFFSALRRMRETDRPIAFKPWIYEIARNACIDQFRRASRSEEVSYDAHEGFAPADSLRMVASGAEPDHAVDAKQRITDLCGAFGGLSETHHKILVLRELEGLSYQDIGERMGLSLAAVESTLFRARRRLTEEYEELASGRRCERVQAIVGSASQGLLGARDSQRVARHVSHCQPCRRYARLMGVEGIDAVPARGKLAAILPLPLARRGEAADVAAYTGQPATLMAQVTAGIGTSLEPLAGGWSKAVAAVVAIAVGGAGVGVATEGDPLAAVEGVTRLVRPAAPSDAPVSPTARQLSVPGGTTAASAGSGQAAPLAADDDQTSAAGEAEPGETAPDAAASEPGSGFGAFDVPVPGVPGVPNLPATGLPDLPPVPGPSFPSPPGADVSLPQVPDVSGVTRPPQLPDVPDARAPALPDVSEVTGPQAGLDLTRAAPPVPLPEVPDLGPAGEPVRSAVRAGADNARAVTEAAKGALPLSGSGG